MDAFLCKVCDLSSKAKLLCSCAVKRQAMRLIECEDFPESHSRIICMIGSELSKGNSLTLQYKIGMSTQSVVAPYSITARSVQSVNVCSRMVDTVHREELSGSSIELPQVSAPPMNDTKTVSENR